MSSTLLAPVDPWQIEIIAIVGRSHSSTERRALSRDVERGLLIRLRHGAYVDRQGFESLSPEDQHVVRARAFVAVSAAPVLFSHWTAALLQGLPVMRERLGALHITVEEDDLRHQQGVVTHQFIVTDSEVVRFGEVAATAVGRTVVDVAGASPFEEGVMAADAALAAGVSRVMLEEAAELAGPRRAARRIEQVIAFAHPGAESAGESRMRVTLMRLGVEVPELQHRIVLADGGQVFLDGLLRSARVGLEFDGVEKYLNPTMAPEGAGKAVVAEKRREDEARRGLRGLLRMGWVEAGSVARLRGMLKDVGVFPTRPRTSFAAYCASALEARPRFLPRRPRWRA